MLSEYDRSYVILLSILSPYTPYPTSHVYPLLTSTRTPLTYHSTIQTYPPSWFVRDGVNGGGNARGRECIVWVYLVSQPMEVGGGYLPFINTLSTQPPINTIYLRPPPSPLSLSLIYLYISFPLLDTCATVWSLLSYL